MHIKRFVSTRFFYTCSVHLWYRFTLHSSLTNFSCASAWCSCHIVITFIYVDRTCLCSSFDWDCMAHSLFYSRPVCSLVHCLALTLSAVAFIVSNSWLLLSTTNDYFNSLLVSSWREKARDRKKMIVRCHTLEPIEPIAAWCKGKFQSKSRHCDTLHKFDDLYFSRRKGAKKHFIWLSAARIFVYAQRSFLISSFFLHINNKTRALAIYRVRITTIARFVQLPLKFFNWKNCSVRRLFFINWNRRRR